MEYFAIVIENKIDSLENGEQTNDYYKYIENQNLLDPEYMQQFKDEIAAEQVALEEEKAAEDAAEAIENSEAAAMTDPNIEVEPTVQEEPEA